MASNHGTISHLLPQTYKRMVSEWLEEDCPGLDYGGFVVGESMAEAKLFGKSAVSTAWTILSGVKTLYVLRTTFDSST